MLADNSLLIISLLKEFRELGAEVSSLRADLNAQLASQSPSTRLRNDDSRDEGLSEQRPWEQIQHKLNDVDEVIKRLDLIVSNIASEQQTGNVPLVVEVESRNQSASTSETPGSQPTTSSPKTHDSNTSQTNSNLDAQYRSPHLLPFIEPPSRDFASSVSGAYDSSSQQDTPMSDTPISIPPECPTPHCFSQTTISAEDIRDGLVLRLAELEMKNAPQKMSTPVIDISLAEMQNHIDIDDDNWQYTSIEYKHGPRGKGYAKVHASSDKPVLDWSTFTASVKRPTLEEARNFFENTVVSPPCTSVPYVTGHVTLPSIQPLDPGLRITSKSALRDLHDEYHHIGWNLSAQRIHCEDMTYREGTIYRGLRSYNEVYAGPGFKLWLVIASHHISKFEEFFERNFICGTCNQRYGHESILFAPSRLEEEGIDYQIEIIGRGEAFRTLPGQPHQVINYGACAARSINYLHDDEEFTPQKAPYCCKCGVSGEYASALVPPPPGPVESERKSRTTSKRHYTQQSQAPKATRACTEILRRLYDDIAKAQKADPLCNIPHIDRSHPSTTQVDVFLRAASIRSKVAINQLSALTYELLHKRQFEANDDAYESANTIDRQMLYLKEKVGQSILASYLVRHAQICLAQVVDEHKKNHMRKSANPADLHRRAKQLGIDNINYHLQEGRNWILVCGPYEGLQPLIPLGSKILGNPLVGSKDGFGVTNKTWHALRNGHLETFHELMDDAFTQALLIAGNIFLGMLNRSVQPVTNWEKVLSDMNNASDLKVCLNLYASIEST